MRAFSDALDSVPMALAENSGLSPIESLASVKSRQVKEKNSRLGVDCMMTGNNGMASFPSLLTVFVRYRLRIIFFSHRYERALRHRPSNWKAPATPPCHSAMPHGPQGKVPTPPLLLIKN